MKTKDKEKEKLPPITRVCGPGPDSSLPFPHPPTSSLPQFPPVVACCGVGVEMGNEPTAFAESVALWVRMGMGMGG